MKLNTLLYIGLMSISISQLEAQITKAPKGLKTADAKYEKLAYIDAIKTYERVAEKGYKSVDMFQKLGNAYYFNAELEKAGRWYSELFAMNTEVDPEYYYRYSQCLKSMGNYTKSDEMMAQFNAKSGNDERAKLYENNKNYLEVIKANSGRFVIEDAGINSEASDYGSSFSGNQLVFASARETEGMSRKKMEWTGAAFTNLFGAEVMTDGSLGKPERLNKNLNSKFNESTPVYTRDGQTMYFTRNNYNNGKRASDNTQTTLLKLYKATKVGEKWDNVIELPFNSDQYSVAHPALSPDDKTLYFASNMPGTMGQADIWRAAINSDGSYGTPENLGSKINTPGRESFPYITNDNELYFATDGHPGLGGLDVFVSKLESDGPTSPVNVGAPINGKTDDFAFLMDDKSRTGFFTSNRDGGKGSDDIYKFTENKKLVCEQSLFGIVTDSKSGEVIANADLILLDSKFVEVQRTKSDNKGAYKFGKVECGAIHYVRASKPEYETSEKKQDIAKQTGKTEMGIMLDKKVVPVKPTDDIAVALGIKMIYFDLDKSFIRADAALELAKILDVMQQNPTMTIDVRSHTDCRNTAKYNAALSDRRAKATVAWLVSKGIKSNRLTGKGYGESTLTNECGCEPTNESPCTDAQHQLNRRSEFIITSM